MTTLQIPTIELNGVIVRLAFPGPLGFLPLAFLQLPGPPYFEGFVVGDGSSGEAQYFSVSAPLKIASGSGVTLELGIGVGTRNAKLEVDPMAWAEFAFHGGLVGAPWQTTRTGTANINSNTSGLSDLDHQAPLQITTGTGTSDYARLALGPTDGFQFGSARAFRACAEIRLPTLSDGTNTFELCFGFSDAPNAVAISTNGFQLRYTHGTNSGQFFAEVKRAGSTTTLNGSVAAVAGQWHRLEIETAATGVEFFIDGTSLGVVAWANFPKGTALAFKAGLFKTAGTSARTCDVVPVNVKIQCVR